MSLSVHTLLKHHFPSMYACKQKQVHLQHTGLHTRSYKQLLNKDVDVCTVTHLKVHTVCMQEDL